MCGIAGIISLQGKEACWTKAIQRMASSMRSRGPDGEGYLLASHGREKARVFSGPDTPVADSSYNFTPKVKINEVSADKGSVFLAHRRLSIIDLSAGGHQPMSTEDGRYWIIFNGEIYNYKEIRQQLIGLGESFVGNSDTEVLLKAYRNWGSDFVDRLNGMFAFCIWDDLDKKIICGRDRIGIKPFYYTIVDGWFIFASDIKAIIASGIYRPQIDTKGLYHALSFGVSPRPLTSFKGVKSLKQAHLLHITKGSDIRETRFWSIPVGIQNNDMKEHDAFSLLEEHLDRAIKYRLVADVPVGTFMSGGIDSTTVSAIAATKHNGIKAFTLAFQADSELNELEQAQATARMHGMEHIVLNVEDESIIEHIDNIIVCYEEPFYDLSPNYVVSKLVADNNVKVVLNGLGGDELFYGYPYYAWENRWYLLKRVRALLKIAGYLPYICHLADRLHRIGKTENAQGFAVAVRSFVTDIEKHKLFIDDSVKEFDTIEDICRQYVDENTHFTSAKEAISYIDILNYIGNHHVYRVDKFTMNFSLEGRLPFLDHELIEAACTIPDKFKLNNGISKYILRKLAGKYIHRSCLEAKKKGFDLPTDRWMRGILKEMVKDRLSSLAKRGIFHPEMIWQIYNQWQVKVRSFRSVWELVSVDLWIDKFIDNPKDLMS